MANLLRLFIAINFSEDIKDVLTRQIQNLKGNTLRGSFTEKDNLHLTLAFIGETKELDHVKLAIDRTVLKININPFIMFIEGLGTFKRREGDIYWVGVRQNHELSELNRVLTLELKQLGFKMDEKIYKPHLTLGRRVILKENMDLAEFKKTLPSLEVPVYTMSLMKSERINGKLVYTEIYNSKLKT